MELNKLPQQLVNECLEVAQSCDGYPFPENGSYSLLCSPGVSLPYKVMKFIEKQHELAYGKRPSHQETVRAALHFEYDVFVDQRGNLYFC